MKFDEFQKKVIDLTTQWGVFEQSSFEDQYALLKEECWEYFESFQMRHQILELGDIIWCLIVCSEIDQQCLAARHPHTSYTTSIEHFESGMARNIALKNFDDALSNAIAIARRKSITTIEIFESVYEKNSKRKGMMFDGKFTKVQSMTEEQLSIYRNRFDDDAFLENEGDW